MTDTKHTPTPLRTGYLGKGNDMTKKTTYEIGLLLKPFKG